MSSTGLYILCLFIYVKINMLNSFKKMILASFVLTSPYIYSSAYAEDNITPDLTIGLNYSLNWQAYKGRSIYHNVLPVVFYDNNTLYIEGDDAGIYLFKNEHHQFRLNILYDSNSFDPSGALYLLDQRRWSILAGASYMRITPIGGFKVQLATDMLSRSQGTIARASYLAAVEQGKWSFYPEFGLQWNNAKYNRYYFGVSETEAKRSGVLAYEPHQSIAPFASIAVNYDVSKHWSVFSSLEFNYLSHEQFKSPMAKKHSEITPSFGVNFNF